MKCKETMDRYLKMDNREALPILLKMHVFFCHSCRDEVDRLQGLLDRMERYAETYSSPGMTEKILAMIETISLEQEERKTTPMRFWLTAGVMILLGTVIIQFVKPSVQVTILAGGTIELPLNLVCCGGLAIFLGVFIASHLEEVSKFLKIHRSH